MAGPREVADLVVFETRSLEYGYRDLVQIGFGILIGKGARLAFLPGGVWRARFNCKAVRRDVIRIELERVLKRLTPTDWRLSRNAEHEIQADAAHSGCTRGFHRSSHVARFVASSHRL